MKIRVSRNNPVFFWQNAIAIGLILFFGLLLQYPYLQEFPLHIHAWAQADWYSIALGYVDNGLDFFHPQTMFYNKQDLDSVLSPVTSVDFPIHEYVVAIWMKVLGSTAPWVFRVWTFVWALVGMFFLYRLAFLFTENPVRSLWISGFAMTAPTYAYYFCGFLPSVPSLTFAIMGLWGYFSYRKTDRMSSFAFGMLCLTLAAMIRSPHWVLWIAVNVFEVCRLLIKKESLRKKLPVWMISITLAASWFIWNRHLLLTYGSMFLGHLMPAASWEDVRMVFHAVRDRWREHYFQQSQQWILLAATLLSLVSGWFFRKSGHRKDAHSAPFCAGYFLMLYFSGACMYVFAMMMQFPDHDYYFLDSLFLPVILLLIYIFYHIPSPNTFRWKSVGAVAMGALLLWMIHGVQDMQRIRRGPTGPSEERTYESYLHYLGADRFLDEAGVPRDARMLALFPYPKSSAFIQMKRRGYIVFRSREEHLRTALTYDYDYIVIEKVKFREEFQHYPELLSRLEPLASNGEIMLCRLSDERVWKNEEETIASEDKESAVCISY